MIVADIMRIHRVRGAWMLPDTISLYGLETLVARRIVLSGTHNRILDFSLDGGTKDVTKWHYNWFRGLLLGDF